MFCKLQPHGVHLFFDSLALDVRQHVRSRAQLQEGPGDVPQVAKQSVQVRVRGRAWGGAGGNASDDDTEQASSLTAERASKEHSTAQGQEEEVDSRGKIQAIHHFDRLHRCG